MTCCNPLYAGGILLSDRRQYEDGYMAGKEKKENNVMATVMNMAPYSVALTKIRDI
jgi:hypothetical protein